MSWTLIDSATEGDALLELYAKDAVFMIRANGLELMNGFCHDSEVTLGQLAAELERFPGRRNRKEDSHLSGDVIQAGHWIGGQHEWDDRFRRTCGNG